MSRAKADGIHYTPPALARFLAEQTLREVTIGDGPFAVLDPACGDGGLLLAVAGAVPESVRCRLTLVGHETDPVALARAGARLTDAGVAEVVLTEGDFLDVGPELDSFDLAIANPPYVRTQVLGAGRARDLARRFGLSGRVDLYQAFIAALGAVLRPGGVLGLLVSNRFLSTQSGAAVRRLLRAEFDPRAVFDLGDTRLFAAAVLPAIVVARKGPTTEGSTCSFHRVYQDRSAGATGDGALSVLDALRDAATGAIATREGAFLIERGTLAVGDGPWALATPGNRRWIAAVHDRRACVFHDVGKVRVGIKTTADRVFIRDDWDELPSALRPEPELLHPLITHHDADRWRTRGPERSFRRILYPHQVRDGRREPIDLADYPRARAYFESHRNRLESRAYVLAAGRRWYEIWVPQDPDDWARPKVVFPDIAESPRFCLDTGGALVNGDCYWITLRPGQDPRRLLLLLAVANSSFITRYYDTVFHNKLYAGRRRFITQYVKQFPLPDLQAPEAVQAVELVARLVAGGIGPDERTRLEAVIDGLVWEAFGLVKEEGQ